MPQKRSEEFSEKLLKENYSSKSDFGGATELNTPSPETLTLSPSVEGVLSLLHNDTISAADFAQEIFKKHEEYARKKAYQLRLEKTPTKRYGSDWLIDVKTLFNPKRIYELWGKRELNGRFVIIGLALLDKELFEQLKPNEVFASLLDELQPHIDSLDEILSDHGKSIYSQSGRKDSDRVISVPNWPDDPLLKTKDDLLGREAFARFLARRIVAIQPSEGAYAIHLYGPWGAGKSTLLNFMKNELRAKNLHLFDIDSKFEEELDDGKISEELRKQFDQNGEKLSNHAAVVPAKAPPQSERAWKIFDDNSEYLIRKKLLEKNEKKQSGTIEVFTTEPRWIIVEFNAWRNQHIDPPWWSLLDAVFTDTKGNLSWFNLLEEYWWRLSSGRVLYIFTAIVLMWILVLFFNWVYNSSSTQDSSQYENFKVYADSMKNLGTIIATVVTIWGGLIAINRSLLLGSAGAAASYKSRVHDPMNEIKKRFETLIENLDPLRVAVFIDDLDRCHSNYVVELLEGIQTLFREAPVVYVVAADRRWIHGCYAQEYEKLAPQIDVPGKSLGDLFLEKAFRFSTAMPGIPDGLRRQYWQHLLDLMPSEGDIDLNSIRSEAKRKVSSAQDERELQGLIDDSQENPILNQFIREEAAVELAAPKKIKRLEHALKPYAKLLEPNPRSMKRLVNSYSANWALSRLAKIDIEHHQLALWTILQARWPSLARYLEKNPKMLEKIGPSASPEGADKDVESLFKDPCVAYVVKGGSLDSKLQEDTIIMCAKMHV